MKRLVFAFFIVANLYGDELKQPEQKESVSNRTRINALKTEDKKEEIKTELGLSDEDKEVFAQCKKGSGKSCYDLHIKMGDSDNKSLSNKLLLLSCIKEYSEGCFQYAKSLEQENPAEAKKYYNIACTHGHTLSCDAVKLMEDPQLQEISKENTPRTISVAPGMDKKSYLGFSAGIGYITSEGGGTPLVIRGRLGHSLYHDNIGSFAAGLYFATGSLSTKIKGIEASSRITAIGLEFIWRNYVYVGGRFGLSIISGELKDSSNTVSLSGTALNVGPVIGIEVPLSNEATFDFEFFWNVTDKTTLGNDSLKADITSTSVLCFLFGLKYLF